MKRLLLVLLVMGLFVFLPACENEDDDVTHGIIKIGGLLPYTGNLSQYSEQLTTFLEFAEEDVNDMLASERKLLTIELICDDTETDGNAATLLAQYMHRISGIDLFVGPLTSGELLVMAQTSLLDSILVLSPGSTAPSLSNPDDNIFRFVTSDSQMANALSQKMWDDGIRAIFTTYRMDDWGEQLSSLVGEAFTALGGQVISNLEFDGSRNSEILYMLDELYPDLAEINLPLEQVALQITSLEEGNQLFQVVADSIDTYPLLDDIRWYGSDGLAQNNYMVSADGINELAARVQYTAPIFGIEGNGEINALADRFAQVSDEEPWTYSYIAYDIVMLIGEALCNVNSPGDLEELRSMVVDLTDTYQGVTGPMRLNSNGDRADGNYDFWQVVESSGEYGWVKIP